MVNILHWLFGIISKFKHEKSNDPCLSQKNVLFENP